MLLIGINCYVYIDVYIWGDRLAVGEVVFRGLKRELVMSGIVEKWGDTVARRGFAQIPNYLLLINQFLDDDSRFTPTELLLLIELVGTWWKKDEMPFPAIRTLATRCGVSERQIQRAIRNLENRALIEREKRRSKRGIIASNSYNLEPLGKFLEEVAAAFPNEYPRKVDRIKLPDYTASDTVAEPSAKRRIIDVN